jgi:hypothetical protein
MSECCGSLFIFEVVAKEIRILIDHRKVLEARLKDARAWKKADERHQLKALKTPKKKLSTSESMTLAVLSSEHLNRAAMVAASPMSHSSNMSGRYNTVACDTSPYFSRKAKSPSASSSQHLVSISLNSLFSVSDEDLKSAGTLFIAEPFSVTSGLYYKHITIVN